MATMTYEATPTTVEELEPEGPQRGDLLSSQETHPKICEDAKKFFDSSLSDPKKCWSFDKASAKACEDDKVKIVPESAIRRN